MKNPPHGITKEFLGFIGYELVKYYEFVIDYNRQTINLYALGADGIPKINHIENEKVVTEIEFKTERKQIPVTTFTLGNNRIHADFDTRAQGSLTLERRTVDQLRDSNLLTPYNQNYWYGTHQAGIQTYSLKRLRYGKTVFPPIHNLGLTIGTRNNVSIGYQFLRNYKSVWNYKTKRIKLLEN